jgi:hypothetical protein
MSCHVSLHPNIGPVIAHARITRTASPKLAGWPVTRATSFEKRVNQDADFAGVMGFS